jgi:pilus assembly protein CpaB
MNSRGLMGLVAVTLAAVATLAVFLYVRGVQDQSRTGGESVQVVVSKQDILAGTDLDELISSGAFTHTSVPSDVLVQGAITRLEQLEGRTTSTAILAGEQISTARLQGSEELPGGVLGIPGGFQATTVGLESERILGESLQDGDRVAVFATFGGSDTGGGAPEGSGSVPDSGGGMTVTLVPDAKVLKIERTQSAGIGANDDRTLVTLALKPRDAQALVFSQELGTVWLSLIPPGQVGVKNPPTTLLEVTR